MEKEITIEGEVYVKKSTLPMPEPPKIHFVHPNVLMDEAKVLGIGTVALNGDWVGVRVSTEYLEKVLKALRACSLQFHAFASLAGGGGIALPRLPLVQWSRQEDSTLALVGGITLPEASMRSSQRFSVLH